MGSNFLIAGFIPSLAFVAIGMFAFGPVLPLSVRTRLGGDLNLFSQAGFISLLATIVLGFTLTSLNTFFIKIFEGYIFLEHIPTLRKSELRKEKKLQSKMNWVKRILARYEGNMGHPTAQKYLSILNELQIQYDRRFPIHRAEMMPTQFGNILKAAEGYSRERYQIDAVPMWPRIISVIPTGYNLRIEETHNQLSFLVNCSLLAGLLGIQSLLVSIFQAISVNFVARGLNQILYFIPVFPNLVDVYTQRIWLYLCFALIAFFMMYIFYRAALLSVVDFGDMIRSVYDLFRFDLLKQLHLPLPRNSNREGTLWGKICEFINVGYSLDSETEEDQDLDDQRNLTPAEQEIRDDKHSKLVFNHDIAEKPAV